MNNSQQETNCPKKMSNLSDINSASELPDLGQEMHDRPIEPTYDGYVCSILS